MLRQAMVFIICLNLSACCGFKMRGMLDVPDYLQTICITPYEPYEPLQTILRARLKQQHVKIVNAPTDDVAVLQVSKSTSNEQMLAYSSSGEVQRYTLSVSVSYTLIVKGAHSMHLQRSITRTRELNRSNNMLLSNEGEEQVVKKELLNETVNELLRQITTERPQHKDNP